MMANTITHALAKVFATREKGDNMGDNRWAVYERLKAEIARTARSAAEYERRVKALARRLNL